MNGGSVYGRVGAFFGMCRKNTKSTSFSARSGSTEACVEPQPQVNPPIEKVFTMPLALKLV